MEPNHGGEYCVVGHYTVPNFRFEMLSETSLGLDYSTLKFILNNKWLECFNKTNFPTLY